MKTLMIIEGPGKIATIKKNLKDPDLTVIATGGHISKFDDSVNDGYGFDFKTFNPHFVLDANKAGAAAIAKINKLAQDVDVIYLATDPDREGEGIAVSVYDNIYSKYHDKIKRITFTEISRSCILKAMANPVGIDWSMYQAYLTRAQYDELFGFKGTKFSWQAGQRTVGRVQSVVLKILVDRENEIKNFQPTYYFLFQPVINVDNNHVVLKLTDSRLKTKLTVKNEDYSDSKETIVQNSKEYKFATKEECDLLLKSLSDQYQFMHTENSESLSKPKNPFITSTLLQEVNNKFKIPAVQIQNTYLQRLYELGLITYPRTDSIKIDDEFLNYGEQWIKERWAEHLEYVDTSYPFNHAKEKDNTQEGHCAIRITNFNLDTYQKMVEVNQTHEQASGIKKGLDDRQLMNMWKVYSLIYDRTYTCFLKPAIYDKSVLSFKNTLTSTFNGLNDLMFSTEVKILRFDGWLKYQKEMALNRSNINDDSIQIHPVLNQFYPLIDHKQNKDFFISTHDNPKPRFSEATLIGYLEKNEIGRPSTYAQMVSKNNEPDKYGHSNSSLLRNMDKQALMEYDPNLLNLQKSNGDIIIPTKWGFIQNDFNAKIFSAFINNDFTKHWETLLDKIATDNESLAKQERVDYLKEQYDAIENCISAAATTPYYQSLVEQKSAKYKGTLVPDAHCTIPECDGKIYEKELKFKDQKLHKVWVCEFNKQFNDGHLFKIIDQNKVLVPNITCEQCGGKVYKWPVKLKNGGVREFEACEHYNYKTDPNHFNQWLEDPIIAKLKATLPPDCAVSGYECKECIKNNQPYQIIKHYGISKQKTKYAMLSCSNKQNKDDAHFFQWVDDKPVVGTCPICHKNVYAYTTKNHKHYKACEDFSWDEDKRKCSYMEWENEPKAMKKRMS